MTISIWRYAHLALAVFSFLFLAAASISGTILAVDAVDQQLPDYRVDDFNRITLSQVIPTLQKEYLEVTELSVDHREFVTLQGLDHDGNDINAFIDPQSGIILGNPEPQSDFIKWVTAFHRSLFLKETGRIFVGIISFILALIALSGMALVIQRQKGLRRFFGKVVKEYFAQYYHVVAGRLLLIPILILALSGAYLTVDKFNFFTAEPKPHQFPEEVNQNPSKGNIADFTFFKNTPLSEVEKIEFPFAPDPEEYFRITLNGREVVVDQFSGEIVSEVPTGSAKFWTDLNLDLHTGRSSIIWAIILAIASLNILYFIFSGFKMTLKRRTITIKNKFKAEESTIILLVGSENGSTLSFANAIHQQFLANGKKSFLTEMNQFKTFPQAGHIIVFAATNGLGDPPSNATKFIDLLSNHSFANLVNFSVVGFGSHSYPEFCGFAKKVDEALSDQPLANRFLDLHTVDDKSVAQFVAWTKAWSEKSEITLAVTPALYNQKPRNLDKLFVLGKTIVTENEQTFVITFNGDKLKFTSGDLLAIYPANDNRERLYSIGKVDGNIQLVVKLYENGLGSEFLNSLSAGDVINARIISNTSFHLPTKAPAIAMVANGAGIAPFLGMIAQNSKKKNIRLYSGFRKESPVTQLYRKHAELFTHKKQLQDLQFAFSREDSRIYVMDLINRDADYFAELLQSGGVIMICGALAMQTDVENTLGKICLERNHVALDSYKSNGQILTDCY
ncbi:MAG: PepSY domain-containing protein [Flavobacterium sp.]|nr:PepSY domain-containing protein [Flavobacterium sp.]